MCQNLWVWGFHLWGGACDGYDDFLVWGLCAFELLPKCRVLWALNYVCTYCVSGTLVSDCYWSVT